jgi:hypothetical protein
MPYVYSFEETNVCVTLNQQSCIFKKVYANIDDVYSKCVYCPLECDSKRFLLSASSGEFPTPRYANDIINSTNFLKEIFVNYDLNSSAIKTSVLSFTVYYSELKLTEIRELRKFTPIDLITGIGGTLGK